MRVDDDHELSGIIIGAAIDVHRELGPGNGEVLYEEALCLRLGELGINFERQRKLPVIYRDREIDCSLQLDILIEGRLPLELKAVNTVLPIHEAQLLTYMKLGEFPLGLLVNFEVTLLKEGSQRKALSKPSLSNHEWRNTAPPAEFDSISAEILDSAVAVHSLLGKGLLKSVYEKCLASEFALRGIPVATDLEIPSSFNSHLLSQPFRLPLVANGTTPIFCFSKSGLTPKDGATLRARLRQGHFPYGFLFNFGGLTLAEGARRIETPL